MNPSPALAAFTIPCSSWKAAAQLAFRTGKAPIRINRRWYVRGVA